MLWRSKSNKNRTAHGGGEPVAGSTPQADPAKSPQQTAQTSALASSDAASGGAPAGQQNAPGTSPLEAAGVMPQSQRTVKVAAAIQEAEEAEPVVPAKEMLEKANRPSREEMLEQMAQSPEGQEMLRKLQGLRSSMDSLRKQQDEDPIGAAEHLQQEQRGAQNIQHMQQKPQVSMPHENIPQTAGQTGMQQPAAAAAADGRTAGNTFTESGAPSGARDSAADEERIRAAEQAVLKGVQEDAQAKRRLEEEARLRQMQIEEEQQKALEAQMRAAKISEEAEQKRQEALEAEKKAKEVSRKKALEAMEAERRAREEAEMRQQGAAGISETQKPVSGNGAQAGDGSARAGSTPGAAATQHPGSVPIKSVLGESAGMATPEEKAAFFGEPAKIDGASTEEQLEALKETLQNEQAQQEKVFDAISTVAERHTERLSESQKAKVQELAEAQQQATQEQKLRLQIQQMKTEQEKAKAEAVVRSKSEKARRKAEEKQRHKEEVRKQRLEKVARKRAEKARKLEARERHKQEKRRIAEARKRLEEQSKADAELGGGIVNVQGVQIKTEVNKHPTFSLRDFFGIRSKAEKQASTEEEQAKLAEERKERQLQAHAAAYIRSIQRRANYEKSKIGQKLERLKSYSEEHKKGMLMVFSIVMMAILGGAGVLNYCTAYEYSYNGQVLGLVKEKDDVLQITDLVQTALTEEKNMKIVIDAKDDITFHRKLALDETQIDDSEQVLKRLTYMGDLKVKATAIYVDGKKIGAVQDRKSAEQALKDVAEKYTKTGDNVEIESVRFLEKVDIKTANTDLSDLYSEKEMVDMLCTSGEKETMHKVVAGDTLHSISKKYDVWEDQLLADNPGINSKKLDVGSTIVVKQQAPVLTYEVVEKMTYDKTIKHEVEEQKSGDIYEGITETKQAGSDGVSEVTARITTQNGKKVKEEDLVTTVKTEPVTEIVLVGTKERPPTVGSGKYIWPLKDSFTRTSGFGARWGRMHKGIDLAVGVGTTVYAADGGTVIEAQYSGSYGNVVVIDHQNGQETRYAHNSKLLVKKGDKVYQGQPIAKSGNTGRSTGPHVHFEIRINGEPRNPLNYLP